MPFYRTPGEWFRLHTYIDWYIATFGPSDLYELCNECNPSEPWAADIAAYIRSKDPGKPITNSWNTNAAPYTDFFSPHQYESDNVFNADRRITDLNFTGAGGGACCGPDNGGPYRRFNKPIVGGEGGETGANWNSNTPTRLRLRLWTGLFQESYQGYWNEASCKGCGNRAAGNLFIGAEERAINKSFADFAEWLKDPSAKRISLVPSVPALVRAYGLSGAKQFAAYLHAFTNHASPTNGVILEVDPSFANGGGRWINPTTGATLSTFGLTGSGVRMLTVPAFTTDIALRIDAASAPMINSAQDRLEAAPGSVVTIEGVRLSSQTLYADSVPLPRQLGDTQVIVNGTAAPLFSVSPNQIELQLPYAISENWEIVVRVSGMESAPFRLQVVPASPEILGVNDRGDGLLEIYATGLGAIDPPLEPGAGGSPEEPFNRTVLPVLVLLKTEVSESVLEPLYSGSVPFQVGRYQVNIRPPTGLERGELRLQVGDRFSGAKPLEKVSVR